MRKRISSLFVICLFLLTATGCSQSEDEELSLQQRAVFINESEDETEKENIESNESVSEETEGSREFAAKVLVPAADGIEVYEEGEVSLDASHTSEGYIMLNYNGSNPKVKFQIKTPDGIDYTYLVTEYGSYVAYPLSDGSGSYEFIVYEAASVEKNLYAMAMSQTLSINISEEYLPFLYSNCYVDFNASSACVKKGEELAKGCNSDLDVVTAVYEYVTKNITYDYEKAQTVQPGYTPYPDDTLASGEGICFDYASLMASMLRSQGIPTRLEVGYMEEIYHAWISCYIEETGWIDNIIEFDGKNWTLMDPTTAAENNSRSVVELQEKNGYIIKYLY